MGAAEWIRRRLPLAEATFAALSEQFKVGHLVLTTPDGRQLAFGGQEPGITADLVLRNWSPVWLSSTRGDVGFAESYVEGSWDSNNLAGLLTLVLLNADTFRRFIAGGPWSRALLRLRHLLRPNSRRGSRRNIRAHYDLGNEFFRLWLDPGMTYSSAFFDGSVERSLEEAQAAKYERILDAIGARPGLRVLEIGCGWGGFAEAAARRGCQVTGITLSTEQLAYARERLARAGLGERVELVLQDYRSTEGQYDAVVAIEMIEAVGERYWPAFFGVVRDRLAPAGRAAIQAITIADHLFADYRRSSDFIREYIFPGGMLLSPSRLRAEGLAAGLHLERAFAFGADYARTLATWLTRFDAAIEPIRALGYDERFVRRWRFYLASCEASFRTGRTDVVQAEFIHA